MAFRAKIPNQHFHHDQHMRMNESPLYACQAEDLTLKFESQKSLDFLVGYLHKGCWETRHLLASYHKSRQRSNGQSNLIKWIGATNIPLRASRVKLDYGTPDTPQRKQ